MNDTVTLRQADSPDRISYKRLDLLGRRLDQWLEARRRGTALRRATLPESVRFIPHTEKTRQEWEARVAAHSGQCRKKKQREDLGYTVLPWINERNRRKNRKASK